MLVLGGVHAAAQRVGHLPEFGLVAGGGAIVLRSLIHLETSRLWPAVVTRLGSRVSARNASHSPRVSISCRPGEEVHVVYRNYVQLTVLL